MKSIGVASSERDARFDTVSLLVPVAVCSETSVRSIPSICYFNRSREKTQCMGFVLSGHRGLYWYARVSPAFI